LAHGVVVRTPQPGANETLARPQLQVERGCLHLAVARVVDLRALPGLVGALVVGKAGIAVDPEQRAAGARRIGVEVPADRGHRGLQVPEQPLVGFAHVPLVVGLVGVEPGPVVVARKGTEEAPGRVTEIGSHGWIVGWARCRRAKPVPGAERQLPPCRWPALATRR